MDMKKAFGLLTSIACVYFTSTDTPFKASRGTGSKLQHSDPSLPRKHDVTHTMSLNNTDVLGGRSLSTSFRLSRSLEEMAVCLSSCLGEESANCTLIFSLA